MQPIMKLPAKQKGIALLMLIIIIVLAYASYFMSGLSITEINVNREIKTFAALKKAKQALIHYALVEADRDLGRSGQFGFLPCPDYTSGAMIEGDQDSSCGVAKASAVGWLPWRTLDLPYLSDDSGTCLLYAVSGDYKQTPQVVEESMLNEDTNGQLQVVDDTATPIEGILPEDRIVAIVFAPGTVMSGQNRTFAANSKCGQDYGDAQNAPEYLEGDGVTDNGALSGLADTVEQFIHATLNSQNAATPYNDRFVTITRDEIWSAILQRNDFVDKMTNLTEALALCLAEYNNGVAVDEYDRLPWPSPLALADYRINTDYDDVAIYAGRVPFIVGNSNGATGEAVADLFASTGCNNLVLTIGGDVADLSDANDEYRRLWENWKDHFYYALSSDFEPAAAQADDCTGNCITVGVAEVAGVVFFSGTRLPGITRNSPPIDADDKAVVSNYIENGNDAIFTGPADGIADAYSTSASNDIMFCISGVLPFTVAAC